MPLVNAIVWKYLNHEALLTSPSSLHTAMKKDLDSMKSRYNEASDKLLEKSRQLQKLQVCSSYGGSHILYA